MVTIACNYFNAIQKKTVRKLQLVTHLGRMWRLARDAVDASTDGASGDWYNSVSV